MKKRRLAMSLIAVALLSACKATESGTFYLFDTTVSAVLYESEQENIDYLENYLTTLSGELDAYAKPAEGTSTLYTLNHTNEPVEVSQGLFDALSFAVSMQEATEGYFNPFIGAISSLWKDDVLSKTDPTASDVSGVESQLPELLREMRATSLTMDQEKLTVRRNGEGLIDLGALAKGYAFLGVRDYLRKEGIGAYLVNGGTSSILLGTTAKGEPWKVNFNDAPNCYFKAASTALATSSESEQCVRVDGTTYSHIVNPFTGEAVSPYRMCTVVSEDPALDDVLSTAFMLAGGSKAKELSASIGKTYGVDLAFALLSFDENGNGVWDDNGTLEIMAAQ
ncbi:MAG: FAD:protein FMN transferase [Bacilli bacterium]|nr:FAD:protein FMN transferase [Bacilli bacterium]